MAAATCGSTALGPKTKLTHAALTRKGGAAALHPDPRRLVHGLRGTGRPRLVQWQHHALFSCSMQRAGLRAHLCKARAHAAHGACATRALACRWASSGQAPWRPDDGWRPAGRRLRQRRHGTGRPRHGSLYARAAAPTHWQSVRWRGPRPQRMVRAAQACNAESSARLWVSGGAACPEMGGTCRVRHKLVSIIFVIKLGVNKQSGCKADWLVCASQLLCVVGKRLYGTHLIRQSL